MRNITAEIVRSLREFGSNPFSLADLQTVFKVDDVWRRAKALADDGLLVPLKRNLYVMSEAFSGRSASPLSLANRICTPSYVSRESALRFYGLIPEGVVNVTSSRLGRSVVFENAFGAFFYRQVDRDIYPIGLCDETDATSPFVCARPEKALYDLVVARPRLTLRTRIETRQFLFEDLRLDASAKFSAALFDELIAAGRKRTTMELIRKELCDGPI